MIVRRAWPWLAGAIVLVLANLWLIAFDVNQLDEAWTLWVARRLSEGDRLYADVWFGTTPLSAYLLLGATSLFGAEVLVLKALTAFLAAASALLVARIGLLCGMRTAGAALLALLSLPLAHAVPVSLYTPLAVLFLLACELAAVAAVSRARERGAALVALAGVMAGLSFASKQNVGTFALAALVATLLAVEPTRAGLRRATAATLAFGVVAATTVATMLASGGIRRTLGALGLDKGEYLEHGVVPYHRTLLDRSRALIEPQVWIDQVAGRDRDLLVQTPKALLPVVTALLLVAAWIAWARRLRRARRLEPRLVAVSAFALAGFASAIPRLDIIHLLWVAPPLIAASGVAATFLVRATGRAPRLVSAALASGWALFVLGGPLADWRGDHVRLDLPHFAGVRTKESTRTQAREAVDGLRSAASDRAILVVVRQASFYYLAAELRNPTRFDYPAVTIIGDDEVEEILHEVRRGTIETACLPPRRSLPSDALGVGRPLSLERALRAELSPGPDLGVCRIWRARR